ncbi:MAG: hypothetical protein QM765_26515 [Myxococcales bacterium]
MISPLSTLCAALLCGTPSSTATAKVVEVDPNGNATTVTTVKTPATQSGLLKAGEIAQAENCALRMEARCAAARRCPAFKAAARILILEGNGPGYRNAHLPCDRIGEICGELTGKALYLRRAVERCVQDMAKVGCPREVTVPRPYKMALNPEFEVPACALLVETDRIHPPWLYSGPEETMELALDQVARTQGDLMGPRKPPNMGEVQRADEAEQARKAPAPDAGCRHVRCFDQCCDEGQVCAHMGEARPKCLRPPSGTQ